MKSFMLSLISCSFLLFSLPAAAVDKIPITGQPVVVQEKAGVYVPSTTVTVGQDYYYFTIEGTQRVCYREVNPALVNVNASVYNVRIGDGLVSLHCYDYSPEYFIIQ